MIKDLIIEEIHRYREKHAAKFNFDIQKIVKYYKQRQQENNKKTVNFARSTEQTTLQ